MEAEVDEVAAGEEVADAVEADVVVLLLVVVVIGSKPAEN